MEKVVIALDAMGGDYAPEQTVKGAVEAVNSSDEIRVILVGKQDMIAKELEKYEYAKEDIEVVHASEIIDMGDVPTVAIKDKKDSSLVVAMRLVREGKADALVSAGSTGAVLVGGQLVVGRLKGIKRPPLAPFIPTTKGFSLLIDCGANVDARPEHLVQFAQMGSIYYENVMGKKNPTVALLNIGTEEEKGNQLVKDTKPLMKECKNINYIGSVEARELVSGAADVIVCEAFVGNVVLKFFEGLALTLFGSLKEGLMSSTRTKLGALLVKPALKGLKNQFDTSSQGGAPLLGLKGLVVKAHGNSSSKEIEIALKQCISFKKQKINEKIKESICD
ncbi:MAG: phosphate acyltransferase PlsX [Roseburia sp.]|jgi:glycerol-3-phosphate acyltransferase PlsX|nr:phosphate acyltransferase PlsX [Roseburia sp.]MCI5495601.1 phosphate acyltransferase PlsX [Roseburia sp.]PWM03429.1 MAG: phosphate acyltransferase PlsX [Clostridiales bacterium]